MAGKVRAARQPSPRLRHNAAVSHIRALACVIALRAGRGARGGDRPRRFSQDGARQVLHRGSERGHASGVLPPGARVRTRVFVRPRSKCVPTQRLARSHTHRRARVLLPAGAEPRGTFQAAPSMQSGQTGAADAEVSPMHDSASFRRPKLPPLAPDSGDAPTRPAGRPDAPWQKSMPRMDVSLATGDDTLMCAGAGPAHSKRNGCADAGTNGSAPTPASCFLCQ